MQKRVVFSFLILLLCCSFASAIQLKKITELPGTVTIATDGSKRLFFVQQTGRIRIWDGKQLLAQPFLDLSSEIGCCGERGLLGLAFHPDYATNGFFYVYYTRHGGDIIIGRFQVSGNPNVADPNSFLKMLVISHHEFSNHNGGQLQFGPDGYLYIGVGDGGLGGDPHNNAQNLGLLLGKLLRIDVDRGSRYRNPSDNPFVSDPNARREIWDYGLRNPWRFTFDRQTGDLYIADVGQGKREEIDFEQAGGKGGRNYGWHRMEGRLCYDPTTDCRIPGLKMPILQYSHRHGRCAIIGGYVYRGSRIPSLFGTYLYTDLCTATIWGARHKESGGWDSEVLLQPDPHTFSTFGEDRAGELYLVDLNGPIFKIVE